MVVFEFTVLKLIKPLVVIIIVVVVIIIIELAEFKLEFAELFSVK